VRARTQPRASARQGRVSPGLFDEYPDQQVSRLDLRVVAVLQQRDPLHPAVRETRPHLLIEPALLLVQHGPVQACPGLGFGQRLGDPFAHVALPPGPCGAEQVQADAAGDRRQPAAGGLDGLPLLPGQGMPASGRLLDGILSFGQGAEEPVGEVDQRRSLMIASRPGRRPGRVPARMDWSWCRLLLRSHLPSLVRQDSAPECEAGALVAPLTST